MSPCGREDARQGHYDTGAGDQRELEEGMVDVQNGRALRLVRVGMRKAVVADREICCGAVKFARFDRLPTGFIWP